MYGGAAIVNSNPPPSGLPSMSFDGVSGWAIINSAAALDMAAGVDFTLEFWVCPTDDSSGTILAVQSTAPNAFTGLPGVYTSGTAKNGTQYLLVNMDFSGGAYGVTINVEGQGPNGYWTLSSRNAASSSIAVLTPGVWVHVALVKSGTTTSLYLRGVLATDTVSEGEGYAEATSRGGNVVIIGTALVNPVLPDSPTGGTVGINGGQYCPPINAQIAELRVSTGVARYTADFTPSATMEDASGAYSTAVISASPSLINYVAPIIGVFDIAPPAAVVVAAGTIGEVVIGTGSALVTAPVATLTATGSPSHYGAQLGYPPPTVSAYGGATAALAAPSFILTITGTVTNWGNAAITPPAATISATGTVSATAGAALLLPMSKLVGYFGAVSSITLDNGPTISATGTSGTIGGASIVAPLYDLTATGSVHGLSYANLIAPSARFGATAQAWVIAPGATLTAVGHAVVTATYEAYALNLNHTSRYSAGQPVKPTDELTHYTNFPFTQIVRYQNSYFGANSTGLYLLEGTTDDGAPIEWDVQTAITDFGTPQLKTVEMAFFGGRLGPAAEITLFVGETAADPYTYTTPRDTTAKNYRQAFGRGLKARYYALAVKGTDELVLDSVTLNIAKLARRI